jgi:hypothetical protein
MLFHEELGTIAMAMMSAVTTKVPMFGFGFFGVHLHHEEERLSSQSTRTTPGMS